MLIKGELLVDMDVDLALHNRWYHVSSSLCPPLASPDDTLNVILMLTMIGSNSEEGLSAREGLLLWCQRKTSVSPYQEDGVEVRDFGKSFSSGLAL